MKVGTQVIYVPTHAEGDLAHPDCEEGFITSIKGDHAFCRYWSKYHLGELRTKANSELTPIACLVEADTHYQSEVFSLLWKLGYLE